MLIRSSRSTDSFSRLPSTQPIHRASSPSTEQCLIQQRQFSSTLPLPLNNSNRINISPSSLSRTLLLKPNQQQNNNNNINNNNNMFRRSSSVSTLSTQKYDYSQPQQAIYIPRSHATNIPTPNFATPHASSTQQKTKHTHTPIMTRAPRIKRTQHKRIFKASSRAATQKQQQKQQQQQHDQQLIDGLLDEHIEHEHDHQQESSLSTVTGTWESPVALTHVSTSPPSLSLSSTSSSSPDMILFTDHSSSSDNNNSSSSSPMLLSSSTSPVLTYDSNQSSTSSPLLLSSSSSPILTYHTPSVSDYELVSSTSSSTSDDHLTPITLGQCGSYLLRCKHTQSLSIFKPQQEEMFEEKRLLLDMKEKQQQKKKMDEISMDTISMMEMNVIDKTPIKKGVVYGDSTLKEVAAYLMDHNGFAGVPNTISTNILLPIKEHDNKPEIPSTSSALVQYGPTPPSTNTNTQLIYGSLQEYRQHICSAEDIGSSLFPTDEIHKIGILDIRLLNLDRHLGNLLVSKDNNDGSYHLIPIDHGYTLPSYQDLSDVALEWRWWRQASQPFSPETLDYISRLDPLEDARVLRMLGIRDESLVAMVFSTMLLQRAASAGLTLQTIASMVCRDSLGENPSILELIISDVLSLMKTNNDGIVTTMTTTTATTDDGVQSSHKEMDENHEVSSSETVSTPLSSLSVHELDEDSTLSPSSTSALPISITPPVINKSSPSQSPTASPSFSSMSSSYTNSPTCSSLSSSVSSLTNFSLKPSPSIQKLFSFATLPTVTETKHTRHSSQLSHVEDEDEGDDEREESDEEDVDEMEHQQQQQHDDTFRWDGDSEHDGHEQHQARARLNSVSSATDSATASGSEEDLSTREAPRPRSRRPSRRASTRRSSALHTTTSSTATTASPSSSPPTDSSASSLPIVVDDGLTNRLQQLLRTTEIVIDREIQRIKGETTTTTGQA